MKVVPGEFAVMFGSMLELVPWFTPLTEFANVIPALTKAGFVIASGAFILLCWLCVLIFTLCSLNFGQPLYEAGCPSALQFTQYGILPEWSECCAFTLHSPGL